MHLAYTARSTSVLLNYKGTEDLLTVLSEFVGDMERRMKGNVPRSPAERLLTLVLFAFLLALLLKACRGDRGAAVKGGRGSEARGSRAGGRRRSVPHSMSHVSIMLTALSLILIFACHGASPGRPEGPTALFDLASGGEAQRYEDLPFPNDLFFARDERGVEKIRIGGLDSLMSRYTGVISQAFLQMDGFGTSSTIIFRFDGPLDEASLPAGPADTARAGASVFLLNLEVGERVPIDLRYDEARRALDLIPPMGAPLSPKTRYAAVVTRRVRGVHPDTGDEGPVAPSETMSAILDPERDPAADAPLTRARELYAGPLRKILALPDIRSIDDLAAVTVFTTQSTTDVLVAIQGQLPDAPLPEIRFDRIWSTEADLDGLLGRPEQELPGLDNPGGVAHGNIRLAATGTYTTVWYKSPLAAEAPIPRALTRLLTGIHDDGRFILADGEPVPQGARDVPFAVTLPHAPPAGMEAYPVAIYQHGLGGARADLFGVANTLCGAGYVVVAIDAVGQGARYSAVDEVHNFTGELGPDGFPDESSLSLSLGIFEGFLGIISMRDNFRQSVVDLMQLVRCLRDPAADLEAIGSPKLAPDQIAYVGKSLGTLLGVPFLALEPAVRAGVLSVGGGGLGNALFTDSPAVAGPAFPVLSILFGMPDWCPDRFDPLINLAHAIVEPGDPLSFARHVIHEPFALEAGGPGPPKSVLMTEVLDDEFIPNASTENLALALRLPLASPFAKAIEGMEVFEAPLSGNFTVHGTAVTGALVQYHPASHGAIDVRTGMLEFIPGFPHPCPDPFPQRPEPVPCPNPTDEAQAQLLHFLETARLGAGGTPEIVVTAPPAPWP